MRMSRSVSIALHVVLSVFFFIGPLPKSKRLMRMRDNANVSKREKLEQMRTAVVRLARAKSHPPKEEEACSWTIEGDGVHALV